MSLCLGVDIGGTKIQFCRIGPDLVAQALGATPTALMRRGTTAFAADLAMLIRAVLPAAADRVAVSLNGMLDGSTVSYSSLMGGRVDFPLAGFLTDRVGLPVAVGDDIHAMTIAEAHLGAGRDGRALALLNIGTGIGVGCHTDGRVLRGRYGAGLISELLVHIDELGQWRSLDRTVCGRGIREIYALLSGETADAVTVFARQREGGDVAAEKTVTLFSRYLAYVLQMISRFYHPAAIVINGSVREAAAQYLPAAVAQYEAAVEGMFRADVVVSALDHAAERGVLIAAGADTA